MANETMLIEGYAIVFNERTLLYEYEGVKFYEIIDSGALQGADLSDVLLKYNHSDEVFVLAGVKNGSIQLIPDYRGLKIRAELANISAGRDSFELIRTRLLDKMSFAFTIAEEAYDKDTKTRIIKRIKKLWDCAIVSNPAYPQTSVSIVIDESRIKDFQDHKLRTLKERVLSMVKDEEKDIDKAKEKFYNARKQKLKSDINNTLKSGR
jgi:hypothetical protein